MGFTKLFSRIIASSIWNEDVYTKVVWITILAMKDRNQIVEGSVGGLATLARVSNMECQRALEILAAPDPDDSSGIEDGRRIRKIDGGWFVINGDAYRDTDTSEERKVYMANYMKEYRKRLRKQYVNRRKQQLTGVNPLSSPQSPSSPLDPDPTVNVYVNPPSSLPQSPSSPLSSPDPNPKKSSLNGSSEPVQAALHIEMPASKPKPKKTGKSGPLMNAEAVEKFKANPAYNGIDIDKETWKFGQWCQANEKLETVRRFTNWLNRIA